MPWQHRASASAGGLHPIDLLLLLPERDEVLLYDPLCHALGALALRDADALHSFRGDVAAILPGAEGAVLALVADPTRTGRAYNDSESLVWRDAGCLLATLHLCAEWLELSFCPLGILGQDLARAIAEPDIVFAAGVCLVGEAATPGVGQAE